MKPSKETIIKTLQEDLNYVEDLMDEKTDEAYQNIESHWSAVNTGDSISTPYEVLEQISKHLHLRPGAKFVDLGSGHGTPCIVLGALNSKVHFLGLELVYEKVLGASRSAQKLHLENVNFEVCNLSKVEHEFLKADYYYFYNSVNPEIKDQLTKQIFEISLQQKTVVINAGGLNQSDFRRKNFKIDLFLSSIGVEIYTFDRPEGVE